MFKGEPKVPRGSARKRGSRGDPRAEGEVGAEAQAQAAFTDNTRRQRPPGRRLERIFRKREPSLSRSAVVLWISHRLVIDIKTLLFLGTVALSFSGEIYLKTLKKK